MGVFVDGGGDSGEEAVAYGEQEIKGKLGSIGDGRLCKYSTNAGIYS